MNFTCGICNRKFTSPDDENWNDRKATEEYEANFPVEALRNEPNSLVCDDCYSMAMEMRKVDNRTN